MTAAVVAEIAAVPYLSAAGLAGRVQDGDTGTAVAATPLDGERIQIEGLQMRIYRPSWVSCARRP